MSDGALNNERLREVIKDMLRARKITQSELADELGLSPATIKRTLNTDDLSIDRLTQIARVLGVDFFELIRMAEAQKVQGTQMSEDQEVFLTEDSGRAHVLWRLTNGFSPGKIARDANIKEAEVVRHLEDLKEMDLVERVGIRWRSTIPWPVGFRYKGPMFQKYGEGMFRLFLDHLLNQFDAMQLSVTTKPKWTLHLLQLILREKTYQKYREEHGALLEKYLGISRLERAVENEDDLETVSVLIGSDTVDAALLAFEERSS